MLTPNTMIHSTLEPYRYEAFPREFGLLCWNIQKQNLMLPFNRYLDELLERYNVDLVALQEVKINPNRTGLFEKFHFSFAPNIKFFDHVYGVLNGSRIREKETFSLLSAHRESILQTHKSAIFSYYPLYEGEILLLVNLHAINFSTTKVYHKEIETLFEKIRHHQGAMIVTGDFNSWNRKRMNVVLKLAGALHLQTIEMDQAHLIKSFMKYKLDHIFYRGLQLQEHTVIDIQHFSDHNALYARFRSL